MIKTFETSKGKFEITDSYNHEEVVTICSPVYSVKETVKLISKVSDITEEQAKEVMDFLSGDWEFIYPIHTNKENDKYSEICLSAKQSLYSMIESLSLTDTTNLYLFKIIE